MPDVIRDKDNFSRSIRKGFISLSVARSVKFNRVEAAGCIYDSISEARIALADFYESHSSDDVKLTDFELDRLQDYLSGVKVDGIKVWCDKQDARDIAENYLGLEVIE